MRRLRTALYDLARKVPPERQDSARRYIEHLNATVRDAIKDTEDLPKTVLMLLSVLTKTFLKRHPIV